VKSRSIQFLEPTRTKQWWSRL